MVMKEDSLFAPHEVGRILGRDKNTLIQKLRGHPQLEPGRVSLDLRYPRSFSLDNILALNTTISYPLSVELVEQRACLLAFGYVAGNPKRVALLRHVLPIAEKYPSVYAVFELYQQQGLIKVS